MPARGGPGSAQVGPAVSHARVSVSTMRNQEAGERGFGIAAWIGMCPSLGPHTNRLGHLQPTLSTKFLGLGHAAMLGKKREEDFKYLPLAKMYVPWPS